MRKVKGNTPFGKYAKAAWAERGFDGLWGKVGLRGGGGAGPDGPKYEENSFSNKNWIFEYTKALKICTRRFRRNFDMRVFSKNLLGYPSILEKIKYAMPWYATLSKIN
jgi:hypothetical protein